MERKEEKITKQKNSLLGNPHKICFFLLGLGTVVRLLGAFGANTWTIVEIYLSYKVLTLVMRLFRLLSSVLFTVILILILLLCLSFLLFN